MRSWRDKAACLGADPELFFPSNGPRARRSTRRAQEICAGCPVRAACLEYALDQPNDLEGIWAGTTQSERRRLTKGRYRRRCWVCGRLFDTSSARTRSCSDECRAVNHAHNQRRYNERKRRAA